MGKPNSAPSGGGNGGGGGAFLTQKGEKMSEVKKEISDLEQLLAGSTHTSQSTLLLKKRKEMREVDDSLELMKKDYKKRMDECEDRRLQFEVKQAKMREQVLKFEKFIQENDAKRQRAESKAKHERKQFEDKCKELNALATKIQELELSQRQLQNELAKKSCYRDYLERIVEEGDWGYEEIGDILNRHKTLVDANKDLMTHAAEQDKDVDDVRHRLQVMTTGRQNQLLVSNSYVQDLQNQLETIRSNVKQEEEEKHHLEDKQKNVSREMSQVAQAIKNIFGRCMVTMKNKTALMGGNAHSKEGSLSVSEILQNDLDVMHARVVDLLEMSREYKDALEGGMLGSITTGHIGELGEMSMATLQTGVSASTAHNNSTKPPQSQASTSKQW